MKKIILFLIFSFFLLPFSVKALNLPIDVTASSIIVINLDNNQVIYEKNPDEKVILASLTKMMTAYTVIKNVPDLNKKVVITKKDLSNLYVYTVAGLEEGDKVSYMDLLYAMMLPSGADASKALALHVAGSEEKFNDLMNNEALKLGMRNSNFADSYGGSENDISTAREFSYFIRAALKDPIFKKVFSTDYYTLSNGLRVINYTDSIATFHGFDSSIITGSKSGYTDDAGLLLASTSLINGTNYLIIVCKSELNTYLSTHILDTFKIIDFLKNQEFTTKTVLKRGTTLKKIPVEGGTISDYIAFVDEDIKAFLTDDDYEKIKYDVHLTDKITLDQKKGDIIGFVDILVDEETIDTYHVYLKDDIFSSKKESKILILIIVLLLFLILVILTFNILGKKKKV